MSINLGRTIRSWSSQYGARPALTRAREALGLPGRNASDADVKRVREARAIDLYRDLTIGGLAEGLIGENWRDVITTPAHVLEATEAQDASAFADITGQLLVVIVQEQYQAPEFIGNELVETRDEAAPWIMGPLIVPKITQILDSPSLVEQGMPYPMSRLQEDWISYPAVGKWGEIMNLTLETVMTDRTGQIQDTAAKLGYRARYDLEEQQLSVVLGITNNFSWKNSNYNTYLSGGSNWINKQTGAVLAGGTFVLLNNFEQLFVQITDPYTGKVIRNRPTALLTVPESEYSVRNILHTTDVLQGAFGTTNPNIQAHAPNPLNRQYPLYTSAIARQLLVNSGVSTTNVANYLYAADFKKAFVYRQMLPWTVIQAPAGNPSDFEQDIVMRIKVRRMGQTGVKDPRYAGQSINA